MRAEKRSSEGIRAGRRELDPDARAGYVRRMFSAVAPRYDLTNTVISAGLHRPWKRRTVAALGLREGEAALDLCCGTGDLAFLMARAVGSRGRVVGIDFAHPMLAAARGREERRPNAPNAPRVAFVAGDAMHAPLAAATFDAAAIGFGLRNVADPAVVLSEVRRLLKPGGRLAVLEFARVHNGFLRTLYDLYSFTGLAFLGRIVSGHADAYTYLPVSVRHWLDQAAMLRLLGETGYTGAVAEDLAGGVVAIYRAVAPAA